jgi:hypothetical protein
MNWTHFLLWVAALYALYYVAIVLIDLAGSRRIPAEQHNTQELTFSESISPTKLQHEPGAEATVTTSNTASVKRKAEPEVMASGGVGFNELFRLAKQESIIYTQSVSF